MQIMGSWCAWCSECFRNCCGEKNSESKYLFPSTSFVHQQPVTTVRRISSVGQTITNEDGEEIEMPRHASILQSYNGIPLPFTSNAITIQPGVSKFDLENRLKTMPTISEVPNVPKLTKRHTTWKLPIPSIRKKDYSPTKQKEKTTTGEIQLKRYIRNTSRNGEEDTTTQEDFLRQYQLNAKQKKQNTLKKCSHSSSPNLLAFGQAYEKYSSSSCTVDSLTNISLQPNLAKSTTWLHSQSLEDVKDKKLEAARLAQLYGLDLSLYKDFSGNDPNKTILDLDNPADLFIDESAGFVEFSIYVNTSQNMLSIFISKVGGLSGIGCEKHPFSVLLKVCSLTNKNNPKTSKKMPLDLNPVFNQSFTFYIKNKENRTLRVSVYNSEFLGRFDAIGHALISLQDFECNKNYKQKLYRKTMVGVSSGMLQISCYLTDDKFHVNVIKAFNLLPKFRNIKIYVKISYYSLSRKSKEKISPITSYSGTDKIEFNHQASFRVDISGRKHSYFVISLKKRDLHTMFKNDETVGRVFIGPCFYSEDGKLTPWGRVILNREKLSFTYKMYL